MKKLLLFLFISASAVYFYSCKNADASKPGRVAPKLGNDLHDLGFKNVPSARAAVETSWADFYYKETGLTFIGDDSLLILLNKSGWVAKLAHQFNSNIPIGAAQKIVDNYKKASSVQLYYWDEFWNVYSKVGQDRYGDKDPLNRKGIWVVAPETMFLPDPPRQDPMAIVKVDGGYLVLSAWE